MEDKFPNNNGPKLIRDTFPLSYDIHNPMAPKNYTEKIFEAYDGDVDPS